MTLGPGEQVLIEAKDLPEHDAVGFQISAHTRERVQHEINRIMNEAGETPNCRAEFRRPAMTDGVWQARGYVTNPRWSTE